MLRPSTFKRLKSLGSAGAKAGRGHRVGSIVEFIRHAYVDSSTAYIFSIAEIALKMLSRY
jgi:hypothetical protein